MTGARRRVVLIAVLAAAIQVTPARAQSHQGIARPGDERSKSMLELGSELYGGNCSSCHGSDGRGVSPRAPQHGAGGIEGLGPSLKDAGALAADFYLRTGYMPLDEPRHQPRPRRVLFSDREIRALVAYVASLGRGPAIPDPHPERGDLPEGFHLFTEHCAGCHQVAARGGVVTGANVPALEDVTPRQIAEAVRIGPYVMPTFSRKDISDSQLDSIIAYVQRAQHPVDRGGWGIGNVGPIPEGMVTWFIAVIAFLGTCILIGERLRA